MLLKDSYDMAIDMWAVGVIIYECLIGKHPFIHRLKDKTIHNILNVDIIG